MYEAMYEHDNNKLGCVSKYQWFCMKSLGDVNYNNYNLEHMIILFLYGIKTLH